MSSVGWWPPRALRVASWVQLRGIYKALSVLLVAGLFMLAIEAGSAYVIYLHFAKLHRGYYPTGIASVALGKLVMARHRGRHDEPELSIDHGPLFHADAKLGYAMHPGNYRITERLFGQSHRFTLTVDAHGHRITSFDVKGVSQRIFITGDSAMFGWGLSDEQTLPWLLQARFPSFNVVNLSLTSYSTIQSMRQLEAADPPIGRGDIVVLTYHPITNSFNVAAGETLNYLTGGFEQQLGDAELVKNMKVPFGSIEHDALIVGSYEVACGEKGHVNPACTRRKVSKAEAMRVSEKAFDAILDTYPARYVVGFLSGSDNDPVIVHLKSRGVVVADLRIAPGDPDADDEVSIDRHAGPFWHHMMYERLADVLHRADAIDPVAPNAGVGKSPNL